MTDRRTHRRFVLRESTGEIRLLQDVALESMRSGIVSVIAREPSMDDEELLFHIVSRAGGVAALTVRTLESMPVLVDDVMRHRVRLGVVRAAASPGSLSTAAVETWDEDERLACVLVRRATARVLDVSARGCLLETSAVVTVGASALLDVAVDGRQYIEMIRVCRTMCVSGGGGRSRAGAEFLPTFEAASRSIRPLVAHLEILHSGLVSARPQPDLVPGA